MIQIILQFTGYLHKQKFLYGTFPPGIFRRTNNSIINLYRLH